MAESGIERHLANRRNAMAQDRKPRCTVCGKEKEFAGGICEECKAMIRGEATTKRDQIRKDADRELRKEGVPPKK